MVTIGRTDGMRVSLQSKSVRWQLYASLKLVRIVDIAIVMVTALYVSPALLAAEPGHQAGPETQVAEKQVPAATHLFIKEYRVRGVHKLQQIEVEEAVYPFLGADRGPEDIEQARAALEKAYQAKAYQTVSVSVPSQRGAHGIIVLQVTESPIGRLRVHGSRYFSLKRIKEAAPSLAEGGVPNFNAVTRDVVALNALPDRRITPSLKAGVIPGTVDVDLNVQDTFPLHGSVELNNRYSAGTTPLRLNVSASYNNLWQLGHSLGGSIQVAPENINDVKVFSGYYVMRFAEPSWLTLIAQGVKQESNVSTLGSIATAGRGEVIGARAIITLPPGTDFFHSITLGFDYKHFNQVTTIAAITEPAPITYYPFSANYAATWTTKSSVTNANAGLTFNVRGPGSSAQELDLNRFKADSNFVYLRSDISHQHDLPGHFQFFGRVQGQVSDQPLVNSEQFAGGGLGTVRGYLEAETLGDNGFAGSVELRSPSVFGSASPEANEWRFYVFVDGGYLTLIDPLPEQDSAFGLASVGFGSHIRFRNHFNGSVDLAIPLISEIQTDAFDVRATFRIWADF